MTDRDFSDELIAISDRYARRNPSDERYSLLRSEVQSMVHERQRVQLSFLANKNYSDSTWPPLSALRLTEVGCGNGSNLLEFLRFGFSPHNLTGIELLPHLVEAARHHLPESLSVMAGDASVAPIDSDSQDLVLASTVFSSLLDDEFQRQFADAMWSWLRPGGAVLWYDFTYNNPRNPDVRGVPLRRVQALFPQGRITARRVTLAPPLARALVRVHPALYGLFNSLPWLRTHILCWIEKT